MKHLKVTSALLSAIMCMSMVTAPVAVMADETETPSETQTTEAAEEKEIEEPEEKEPEAVESPVQPEAEAKSEAEDAYLAKGKCGKKAKWTLDKYGTLKITGKGVMYNYKVLDSGVSNAPWRKYQAKIKKVVISKGVTTVGAFSFYGFETLASVSLPSSLKAINYAAFCSCSKLTGITIPKSVTVIGSLAFNGSGLTSIVLPNGVKSIGSFAFGSCMSLQSVTIPASVKTIGEGAFSHSSKLVTVNIPIAGLSTIGIRAFDSCSSLKKIVIPLSVIEIGSFAFENCTNLSDVTIDSTLYSKTTGIFNGCSKLKNPKNHKYAPINYSERKGDFEYVVTFPEIDGTGTVKITGFNPTAEKIVIPDVVELKGVKYKVTRICRNKNTPTENKSLKTLVIGNNVLSIDDNAFSSCTELLSVTGGARLRSIGTRAFAKCPKLRVFYITSKTLWKIGPFAFALDKSLKILQVKQTIKLVKSGVKKSLKGSSIKTVKVKKSKVKKYKKIFKKKNCGRKVKVKK